MARLLGKRTGCSKGKGGSMHFHNPSVGLLGENAIIDAGIPSPMAPRSPARWIAPTGWR